MVKKNSFLIIVLCGIFLIAEVFALISSSFLLKKGIFYSAPSIRPLEYKKYLIRRDKVLGWPAPDQFTEDGNSPYNQDGSRRLPAFPFQKSRPTCISLYGDSFTFGGPPETTWSNILSKYLDCCIANYGVGGYGTDQAYLRFRRNIRDNSPIVILGFSTENILRNVNQYRFLLYRGKGEKFALKPRFIINSKGDLELVPLASYKYEEFLKLVESPEIILQHEYFLPDSKAGILRIKFPFSLSLLRACFNNFHIRNKIKKLPWYSEFYNFDHPSKALSITIKIIEEFSLNAKKSNQRPIIFIIPTGLDLKSFQRTKKWTYQILINELKEKDIEFLDAGPLIIDYIKGGDPCELFYHCSCHYNQNGEQVLADIIYNFLRE